MTEKEIIQIENEIFTQLVIELLREQKASGIKESKDFLLDKYEVERLTKERLKKALLENMTTYQNK